MQQTNPSGAWQAFYASGKIEDYLRYKQAADSEETYADDTQGTGRPGTGNRRNR